MILISPFQILCTRTKKDSWLSVINPFKRLHSTEYKSVFYSSDQEINVSEYCSEDLGLPEGFKKSASASNLLDIDNSLEKNHVLSKSLDFLDTLPMDDDLKSKSCELLEIPEDNFTPRKAQTLPIPNLSPKNAKKYLKSLSVGAHFGSKRFNIGRKMSSVIPWNPQR